MSEAVYLGDSVYATFEDGMLKLYTDNGLGADQVIYLERYVLQGLARYLAESFKLLDGGPKQ